LCQDDLNQEVEWVENADVSDDLRRKLLSLKVCRNRCLAHATSEQALEIATPVLKLLVMLVEYDGSLNPEIEEE
jgi:sister-chromatid-cohesion protein PDS5